MSSGRGGRRRRACGADSSASAGRGRRSPAGKPAGRRAAAGADRRAHASRRARGELLVSPASRRLRVDRARGSPGCVSPTSPAARATAPTCSRRPRREVVGRRRQPRGPRARPAALPAAEPALRARPGRALRGPVDAVVFLQTIEHIHDPGALLARFAGAAAGRLRLDPEPADAGAAGRREVGEPVAPARVHGGRVPRAARAALRRVEISASSTPASCARTSWRSRAGWDRVHRGAADHQAVLRPLHAGDRRVGLRAFAPRPSATSTGARLRRGLPGVSRPAGGGSEAEHAGGRIVGDLAIVLHSHMPYVEGFGTYPFGEEWLFDAVVRSLRAGARGRRPADGDGDARCSPTSSRPRASPSACGRSSREFRIGSCEADAARPRRRAARRVPAAEARPLPRRARAPGGARRRPARLFREPAPRRAGSSWSPRRRPTPSCR